MAAATATQVRAAAARWLSDGVYTLEVQPFPDHAVAATGVDRSKVPEPGAPPKTEFPALQRDTLSNGLKIVLAERRSIPQVRFDLLLDAGYASDQFALPGTASLAMSMLDEGTDTRTALQISDRLADLGATLGSSSRLDVSSVSLEALRERLDPSLELYADVVLHPAFRQADLERLRKQRAGADPAREGRPGGDGTASLPPPHLRTLATRTRNPWSGSGTEASAAKITRDDLVKFHRTWFKPNHATLVVVGATTMAEIRPKLERLFAGWRPGDVPHEEHRRRRRRGEAGGVRARPAGRRSRPC